MRLVERNGLPLYRSDLLEAFPEIDHAFSTRLGGTSEGPYVSLNLGSSTGDHRERVLQNRRRLCDALGAPYPPVLPRQVLGADVVTASEIARDADGVVTSERGRPLLTLSADCVLILLFDAVRRAVAGVHSSRHGARGRIAGNAVELMTREFGSRPRDIVAAVGPSIGPCCYEVREDVIAEWRGSGERFLLARSGRTVLDLWAATRSHLEEAGVRPEAIDEARICTRCRPDQFYSYRRDGARTGRFGALIWIR